VGVVVGILLMKFQKVGAALAAGWGGAIAGMLLNETILFRLGYSWTLWVSVAVCGAAAGFLSVKLFD